MQTRESLIEKGLKYGPTAMPLGLLLFLAGITSGCSALPNVSPSNLPKIPAVGFPKDEQGRTIISTDNSFAWIAIILLTIPVGYFGLRVINDLKERYEEGNRRYERRLAEEKLARNYQAPPPGLNPDSAIDHLGAAIDIAFIRNPSRFAKKVGKAIQAFSEPDED